MPLPDGSWRLCITKEVDGNLVQNYKILDGGDGGKARQYEKTKLIYPEGMTMVLKFGEAVGRHYFKREYFYSREYISRFVSDPLESITHEDYFKWRFNFFIAFEMNSFNPSYNFSLTHTFTMKTFCIHLYRLGNTKYYPYN